MRKVLEVLVLRQKYENTCWAAVAKMVLLYMKRNLDAEHIVENENDPPGSAIERLQQFCGQNFLEDSQNLPEYNEITDEINAGRLLIGFVQSPDGIGHWILITGYDDNDGRPLIQIVDPCNELIEGGNVFWLSYNHIVNNGYMYRIPEDFTRWRILDRQFVSTSYMPR